MRNWGPILLSAFLGILGLPLAIYTGNLTPGPLSATVAWVFLVPLSVSLREVTPRKSFQQGYWFGLVANTGWFLWISVALQKYGYLSFLTASSIMFVMVAAASFLPALGFWALARLPGPRWFVGSLVFTLLYWLLGRFPVGGYPWALPAHFLYAALPLIQIIDHVGVYGLNFLIMLGNFVITEAIVARRTNRPLPKFPLALFGALFLSTLIYGLTRPELNDSPPVPSIRVALLQGNILQDQKRNRAYMARILETYKSLSANAQNSHVDLVVWPEASLPYSIPAETDSMAAILPEQFTAEVVVGAPTYARINGRDGYRNSAFVLAPDGRVRIRYDKQHLVPFGEYVPLSEVLPMYYIVPPVAGNFIAGQGPTLSDVKGKKFGILICYEVLFPELSVEMARAGATFFVNITNDAWFDETSGPYQHVHFTQFRAIETRRAIVRAANTGITTWADPSGRLHNPTDLFTQTTLIADIPTRDDITFFVSWPNLVPATLSLILLLASLGFFEEKTWA